MTDAQLRTASMLWQQGQDTYAIARSVGLPESTVYNFISAIRRGAAAYMRCAA